MVRLQNRNSESRKRAMKDVVDAAALAARRDPNFKGEVRKRLFEPFIYKSLIFLPRQARDKHRKNSEKARFIEGVYLS